MYALTNMLVMCEELTYSLCVDVVCLRELSMSYCIQCREAYCVRSVRLEVDNKRIYKNTQTASDTAHIQVLLLIHSFIKLLLVSR